MTKLHEHQVKIGVTREKRFAVYQHRAGVVSRLKLRHTLRKRPEHLWTEEFDVQ
jgi:hypothetical protein